jgi:hypothetical protein
MDADDEMHPQRLEIISKFFNRYREYDVFYHNYIYLNPQKPTDKFISVNIDENWDKLIFFDIISHKVNDITIITDLEYVRLNPSFDSPVTVGHVTLSRSLFSKHKFPEYKCAEDGVYGSTLIDIGYKIGSSPYKLSKYNCRV